MTLELFFIYVIPLYSVPLLVMLLAHYYLIPEIIELYYDARFKYSLWRLDYMSNGWHFDVQKSSVFA